MASYKQITKGNWKVVVSLGFSIEGKRQRISKQGFKTKKDAENFVNDILTKRNKGYLLNSFSSNVLFKDYMTTWFYEIKSNTLAINTRNDYISRMNSHIFPMLGKYKLNELNTNIIQSFYNSLINDKNMKPVSAKKVLDMVNVCLKKAKKDKLIYELPTDIEKQPMTKPKLEVWDKDQLSFFLDYIKGTELYTPVLIDALTGLRIGELCGLRWEDIDLENGIISVNNQLIHDKRLKVLMLADLKTDTSHRTITIPNILIKHLRELKAFRKADDKDYVIQSKNDYRYTPRSLSMRFTRAVSKFALPVDQVENKSNYMQLPQISFHGLRHTHATILIANNENIKVVSERLGHSSVTMTLNTYTHVLKDMKNKTADLLDNIFK